MSRKAVRYTKGEIGKTGPVVKDFLPPPDRLVLRESNVKVTLSLSSRSVDWGTIYVGRPDVAAISASTIVSVEASGLPVPLLSGRAERSIQAFT